VYINLTLFAHHICRGYLHAVFDYDPDMYDIAVYNKWSYFPHVKPEAMQNGFYNKVDGLQGDQKLFYTGGAFNFELVENSMKNAADLVDKHFPTQMIE